MVPSSSFHDQRMYPKVTFCARVGRKRAVVRHYRTCLSLLDMYAISWSHFFWSIQNLISINSLNREGKRFWQDSIEAIEGNESIDNDKDPPDWIEIDSIEGNWQGKWVRRQNDEEANWRLNGPPSHTWAKNV